MSAVCVAFFAGALLVVLATLREWRSYPGQLLVVGFVIFTGVALYLLRHRVALSAARPPGAVNTD